MAVQKSKISSTKKKIKLHNILYKKYIKKFKNNIYNNINKTDCKCNKHKNRFFFCKICWKIYKLTEFNNKLKIKHIKKEKKREKEKINGKRL